MGWTSFNMTGNVKNWFKNQWNTENSDYEVIDSALVQRKTLYGAIKKKSTGEIFCAVYLIHWTKGYFNFSYKDMTEFSGPYEIDCPEKIFKLLTPLSDDISDCSIQWARRWREDVKSYINKRKLLKGNVIFETSEPVFFSDNSNYTQFQKEGKKYYAGTIINGKFVKSFRAMINPLKYNFKIINL